MPKSAFDVPENVSVGSGATVVMLFVIFLSGERMAWKKLMPGGPESVAANRLRYMIMVATSAAETMGSADALSAAVKLTIATVVDVANGAGALAMDEVLGFAIVVGFIELSVSLNPVQCLMLEADTIDMVRSTVLGTDRAIGSATVGMRRSNESMSTVLE